LLSSSDNRTDLTLFSKKKDLSSLIYFPVPYFPTAAVALYTAGYILLQEKEIFIIIKALDGFFWLNASSAVCTNLAENRGFYPCHACLLNILKAKAVKRDSTIKKY
jgi:hypothetical protein